MIRRWFKILDLKRQHKNLDKVICQILRQPISDKLKDKKIGVVTNRMMEIQIEIEELNQNKDE